jgi:hypothetical protein
VIVHRLKGSSTWKSVKHIAFPKVRCIKLIALFFDKAGMVAVDCALADSFTPRHNVIVHQVVVGVICVVPAFFTRCVGFEGRIGTSFPSGSLENGNQIEIIELRDAGYGVV